MITIQKTQEQIDALKKRIRTLKKAQRDESRKERTERFSDALKKLQAISLEVTATGGRFRHIYPDGISKEYPLSKVTYDPVKAAFYICAGETNQHYNWKTDSHYYVDEFYHSHKNMIRLSSPRIKEINLGTLDSLVDRAETAKRDLSILSAGGRLKRISPAVAIQIIRQRKKQGLRTGFRGNSLKNSNMEKMINMLVKYRDLRATEVLYDQDLTTPYEPTRRIVFFPKLDVYLDLREEENTTYLYGEESSAMKVIRRIRSNDNILGPGGF